MDRGGLPSVTRDRMNSNDNDSISIFEKTAIDMHQYSYAQPQTEYKGVKSRGVLNVSKNKQRNNNFLKTNSEDMNPESTLYEPGMGKHMVPLGYFDRSPQTFNANSEQNVTSRLTDNKIVSSVEFPNLHKTLRTETLYSLKSQQNTSPHARILQTLEKNKKNKIPKPVPNTSLSTVNKESIKKNKSMTQVNKKDKKATRNESNNTKQYYEITTIEEDEENSTQNQFNKMQSSQAPTKGYAQMYQNSRYNSVNNDINEVIHPTERDHNSMTDPEQRRNASQRPRGETMPEKHNQQALRESQSKRDDKINPNQGIAKPLLPKLARKIDGVTTK